MFRNLFRNSFRDVFRGRHYATYKRFNNQVQYSNLFQDPRTLKYGAGFFVVSGIFYITHLEPAPVSGRKRFIFVSESMERMMGRQTYKQIMSQYRGKILPLQDPRSLRVSRIMRRLIEASAIKDDTINWEIHVINSNDPPNAFVIPGGKVFVFSKILPILQNDDGLLTILLHEFSHQLARHSGESMSKLPIYLLLNLVVYALTGMDWFSNAVVTTALQMPLSREMETEADYIGLMLMLKACFNPAELSHVWQRFSEYEKRHGGGALEFLSTHPSSSRRLHNMEQWLPELHMQRELGNCDTSVSGWFNDFKSLSKGDVFGIDTSRRGGDNGGLW